MWRLCLSCCRASPGESYGGVYVPLLARALLRHNERLKQPGAATTSSSSGWNQLYNLAGYLVGNAVTDGMYDGPGQVDFAFGMGLIDPDTYKDVKRTCKVGLCCVDLC
jgi:serine carboxypeptidase-like clade 1